MAISHHDNPIDLFSQWLEEARACKEIADATAMALATADPEGIPDVRMVLLKGADNHGFTFYTNLGSVKAGQLTGNPHAALCFHWAPMERQVRVRGPIVPVTPDEADAYFASRPKQSQIGAWASKQSQQLEGRFELEQRVAYYAAKYSITPVPRPEFWSGFRLNPNRVEFWMAQPFRLHDRVEYVRDSTDGAWTTRRLYP